MHLYLVVVVMFKFSGFPVDLAPVVQKLDSDLHQINLYPVDKYIRETIALSPG